MGILKEIDKRIAIAEDKYNKAKKETRNIRKAGSQVFDFIIPPPKKMKHKRKTKDKSKIIKKGNVTCRCTRN